MNAIGDRMVTLAHPPGPGDHTLGPADARVVLVQYGDYESPACIRAHAVVKAVRHRLGGRLRFTFRHFAASRANRSAQRAAEAAESAGGQGKYWAMHDALYSHAGELDNGHLLEYAVAVGLDPSRFLRDMAAHIYAERVDEQTREGIETGVQASPAFFVNGVPLTDSLSEEALLLAVESASVES